MSFARVKSGWDYCDSSDIPTDFMDIERLQGGSLTMNNCWTWKKKVYILPILLDQSTANGFN